MKRIAAKYATVALSFAGSAILLFSCAGAEPAEPAPEEALMTEYSEHLSIVNSQNGRRSYHFETPLLEGYSEAREPYREFRKGIRMTTYQDDSLTTVDAVLTANYAIYYTARELWEARGDVVVEKSDGRTLYTQQLFWNARTRKVYSNVDSKIVQNGGRDVLVGEGFEADDDFKDWRFRRHRTRLEVEMAPRDPADSAARRESRAQADSAARARRESRNQAAPALPAREPAAARRAAAERPTPAPADAPASRRVDPAAGRQEPAVSRVDPAAGRRKPASRRMDPASSEAAAERSSLREKLRARSAAREAAAAGGPQNVTEHSEQERE